MTDRPDPRDGAGVEESGSWWPLLLIVGIIALPILGYWLVAR